MGIRPLLAVAVGILGWPVGVGAASGDDARASIDARARIVESTLKDLSVRNDAASASKRTVLTPAEQPLDGTPARIRPEPPPAPATTVAGDVSSSLHRLRRETASSMEADGRKARVDESLDRAAEQAAAER
jgi:hypothetical protein